MGTLVERAKSAIEEAKRFEEKRAEREKLEREREKKLEKLTKKAELQRNQEILERLRIKERLESIGREVWQGGNVESKIYKGVNPRLVLQYSWEGLFDHTWDDYDGRGSAAHVSTYTKKVIEGCKMYLSIGVTTEKRKQFIRIRGGYKSGEYHSPDRRPPFKKTSDAHLDLSEPDLEERIEEAIIGDCAKKAKLRLLPIPESEIIRSDIEEVVRFKSQK